MNTDPVSNWDINDIPMTTRPKVDTSIGLQGEIEQITEVMGQQERFLIQTRSDHIRNALIDLGWTPPEGDAEPASILGEEFREAWAPHLMAVRMLIRNPELGGIQRLQTLRLPREDSMGSMG